MTESQEEVVMDLARRFARDMDEEDAADFYGNIADALLTIEQALRDEMD
jgi:hypothetical protein